MSTPDKCKTLTSQRLTVCEEIGLKGLVVAMNNWSDNLSFCVSLTYLLKARAGQICLFSKYGKIRTGFGLLKEVVFKILSYH